MAHPPTRLPLKVTFVTRKWPPAVGGIETYSERLHGRLARTCHVRLLALPGDSSGSNPSQIDMAVFGVLSVLRLLFSRASPDVVHVTDMASWPLGVAARLRSRRTRIVLSAHGTDVAYAYRDGTRPLLYRWYLRIGSTLLRGAQVIANSSATLDLVVRLGFGHGSVIPLGTDFVRAPEPLDRSAILFAGRLIPLKGCLWFAETVLPKLSGDVELRIAGAVWDKSEALVLDLPRVRALGRLDPKRLAAEYARSLCVVVPNIDASEQGFEGFGLVAAEAAAAGGVVLASAVHGLRDTVVDGQTGFLVSPTDPDAWVAAIEQVRTWSTEEREAFIARSTKIATEMFNWDRVAERTIEVYKGDLG